MNPAASRNDRTHGDEGMRGMTDEAAINARTEEFVAGKFNDYESFADLMSGIDSGEYWPQLHRALMQIDNACNGDKIAQQAILRELHLIQRRTKSEAAMIWGEQCANRAEAEFYAEIREAA